MFLAKNICIVFPRTLARRTPCSYLMCGWYLNFWLYYPAHLLLLMCGGWNPYTFLPSLTCECARTPTSTHMRTHTHTPHTHTCARSQSFLGVWHLTGSRASPSITQGSQAQACMLGWGWGQASRHRARGRKGRQKRGCCPSGWTSRHSWDSFRGEGFASLFSRRLGSCENVTPSQGSRESLAPSRTPDPAPKAVSREGASDSRLLTDSALTVLQGRHQPLRI